MLGIEDTNLLLVPVLQQGVQGVGLAQQVLLFGRGPGGGRRGLLEPLAQDVLELDLGAHGVLGPAREGLEDVASRVLFRRVSPLRGNYG